MTPRQMERLKRASLRSAAKSRADHRRAMREYDRMERKVEELRKLVQQPLGETARKRAIGRERTKAALIRHIVFFKFKPEITAEERKTFLRSLRELPSRVPGILEPEVGEDFMGTPRSCHAALIFGFANRAALDLYATHPNHVPVVERARQICESMAAVDFEV